MDLDVRSVSGWGAGQFVTVILQQSGKTYAFRQAHLTTGPETAWRRFGYANLREQSFLEMAGPIPDSWISDSHPDFTPEGAPIKFGFAAGNGESGTYEQLYDNWSLRIGPAIY